MSKPITHILQNTLVFKSTGTIFTGLRVNGPTYNQRTRQRNR